MHPDFDPPFTARQVRELIEHRKKSPWGWRRTTVGEALIWSLLVNVNTKPGARQAKPEDVLPIKRRTNWQSAKAAFWAMGTTVKRKES